MLLRVCSQHSIVNSLYILLTWPGIASNTARAQKTVTPRKDTRLLSQRYIKLCLDSKLMNRKTSGDGLSAYRESNVFKLQLPLMNNLAY